jgi:D-sedoheptulose 7-phosphate isomerase
MSVEIDRAVELCTKAKHDKRRFFFIGNGGSAAIASHMAADWLKNGNVAAQCFNDPALLTCIANDLGYENVFAKPLTLHGGQGDVLFAISSSGQSKSITKAAETAIALRMKVITLSGFKPDNPLRKMGEINFHVPSDRYGEVEIAHHTICHGILDRCITS